MIDRICLWHRYHDFLCFDQARSICFARTRICFALRDWAEEFLSLSPRHKLAGVILMIEQLVLFILQDALFMLGYLARGNAFPKPLERAEEAKLVELAAKGDRAAREKLIEHNLRLCAHIARKYTVPGCDQDDLISIGTVGLIKGVNTFKQGGGTQLSTYCARCIENPMLSRM